MKQKDRRAAAKKTGAVVYLRVSTEEQAKNNSLGTQETQTAELCATLGLTILRSFVDEYSAKTDGRPQLQQMLAFCEQNYHSTAAVVVWKFDRWARNSADHHALKALLRKRGIALKSVCEAVDEGPSGTFMEAVFAAAAQYDNDVRAQRTTLGMQASLAKGRWTFKLPVGYVKQGGLVRIDPTYGPLVREAFERMATGSHPKDRVLAALTRKGLRSSRGRVISPRDFTRMLRNPLYAGIIDAMEVAAAASFEEIVDRTTFDGSSRS
jgi:DNA invertase Pin-like site-specific DNA recombinase